MKLSHRLVVFLTVFLVGPYKGHASFDGLPTDLAVTKIFAATNRDDSGEELPLLTIPDLVRCALVCRKWQKCSSDHRVWRLHYVRHFELSIIPEDIYLASSQFSKLLSSGNIKGLLQHKPLIIEQLKNYFIELDITLFDDDQPQSYGKIISDLLEVVKLPEKVLTHTLGASHPLQIARRLIFLILVIDLFGPRHFIFGWLTVINNYDFNFAHSGCYRQIRDFLASKGCQAAIEIARAVPDEE